MILQRLHIARLVTVIVALQILNMGFFAQDFQSLASSATSPEINIINTVDEYIAEVVLHHKDAVPENNRHPQKDLQAHKHVAFKLISFPKSQIITNRQLVYSSKPTSLVVIYDYLFCDNIIPPPPKC